MLRIENVSRGTVVCSRAGQALKASERMKGLLGRDGLGPGEGLVIAPCTSIHTFFMRFAIDVVFLDGRGTVLRAIERLRPWRMTRIYPRAACVLELPAGTLAATSTREGDVLRTVEFSTQV